MSKQMTEEQHRESLIRRFWDKVDIRGPEDCWEWSGSCVKGYGNMAIRGTERGYAHRVSWIIHFGSIEDGLYVLHKCDNPPCVNPNHLFLGSQTENIADMVAKGRRRSPRKTHCPQGHEYDEENTYWWTNKKGLKQQLCRACWKERNQRRRVGA